MKTRSMAGVMVLAGWTTIAGAVACRAEAPGSTFEVPPMATPPPESGDQAGDDADQPAQPARPTQASALATFTPAEVMNIVEVLNLGEVTQGQLAQRQATNADVKAFATRMVDDHGEVLQRLHGLSGTQTTAETSRAQIAQDPTASVIQRHQELLTTELKSQKGATFDLAYMTAQITEHAKALALIDRALLPSVSPGEAPAPMHQGGGHGAHPMHVGAGGHSTGGAGGSEATPAIPPTPDTGALQTELQSMRTSVASHLAEALWLQKTLRAAPGAASRPGS